MWLIWSNEHGMWWGPNHRGYYLRVSEAGRYTLDEARNICKQRSWEGRVPPETMIHEEDVPYARH